MSADANAPLRRAQILVTAGQLGIRRFTTTDAEGRYEIVELAEGCVVPAAWHQKRPVPGHQPRAVDAEERAAERRGHHRHPLDLTGANIDGLRVVLTDRLTDASGGVTGEDRQPVKEFVVVVQPVEEVAAHALTRFLRTARSDQDGEFGLRGIPPAEYIATAVEALEQGGEWDPEYRSRLRDAGRRFSIKEGESIQLDLELAGL